MADVPAVPYRPPVRRSLVGFLAILLLLQIRSDRSPHDGYGSWFNESGVGLTAMIHDAIRFRYPHPPSSRTLWIAAARGMLQSLNDPYSGLEVDPGPSSLAPPDALAGKIGIVFNYPETGPPRVRVVLPESPAQMAGLQAGDLIVAVNGIPVTREGPTHLIPLLGGMPGTTVDVQVMRDGELRKLATWRELPRADLILRDGMVSGMTGYIHLSQFDPHMGARMLRRVRKLRAKGMNTLVLDLRGNRGGDLVEALHVADLFLDRQVVTILQRRTDSLPGDGLKRDVRRSLPGRVFSGPLVVLINSDSASSAELLAGALQDNGRARLVGTTTFGKGKVQELMHLPDNAGVLRLTIATYLTPRGAPVDGIGISPDLEVRLTDSEEDQLLRVLLSGMYSGNWELPVPEFDSQLAAALEYLQTQDESSHE